MTQPTTQFVTARDLLDYALKKQLPILDVRSPSEYAQGHIPGAINIPLFSDQQRAIVGTLYVHEGKEAAVHKGLEIVGGHLSELVDRAKRAIPARNAIVHCWRGGMRSKSVAALLSSLGYEIRVLEGGYKAFRAHMRELFAAPFSWIVLGGKTGSGKTEMLSLLSKGGHQTIDLERLARHRGSVFGRCGYSEPQPSQEQFENDLGWSLYQLDSTRFVWIEDESPMIGTCAIPKPLLDRMRLSPLVLLDVPYPQRRAAILADYRSFSTDQALACLDRLEKYIGSERASHAKLHVATPEKYIDDLLAYYDKTYDYALERRKKRAGAQTRFYTIPLERPFSAEAVQKVVDAAP